jgi:hypothetical protein
VISLPPLQPRHQRIRIGRFDIKRGLEIAGRICLARRCPPSDTRVPPGARKSSRRTVQDFESVWKLGGNVLAADGPPSMICSEVSSSCVAIGACGIPEISAPQRRQ